MLTDTKLPPPHEILARVFNTPDRVRQLARTLGVSDNHAYKWLRGGGTGAPSDLDRLCRVIFLASTFGDDGMKGAGLIAEYVREYFAEIAELNTGGGYTSEHERVRDSLEVLGEAKDVMEALALGSPAPDVLKEAVELRNAAERIIIRASATASTPQSH